MLLQSQPVNGDATSLDDLLRDPVDEAISGFQDRAEMVDCCSATRNGCATNGMPSPRLLEPVSAILTTILTPLTFITGIDGMNFEPMNELRWHDGFALILAAMLLAAILLVDALQVWWLWRRGWLKDGATPR